jgi:hypothetical protein
MGVGPPLDDMVLEVDRLDRELCSDDGGRELIRLPVGVVGGGMLASANICFRGSPKSPW